MSRQKTNYSSVTTIQTERTAKRLARQQKHLEKEIQVASEYNMTGQTGFSKNRAIRINNLKHIEPLTDTQADFFEAYENDDADALVLYGSAGTGKTMISLYHALQEVLTQESRYKRIIIIRSVVASRDMGFLPGTEEEKMEPYEQPYVSICSDLLGRKDAYTKLKDMGVVEFHSSSFLRGTTFNDAIVLFDEVQNENFANINTIITRIGKNTKLLVCGDSKQNDLTTNKNDQTGFYDFLNVSKNMSEFRHFKFTSDDIVRSQFVKSWIIATERLGL